MLGAIAKRSAAARKTEDREIAALDRRRDARLGQISKQRQSLQARESAALSRALSDMRQQHVDRILRAATISAARIPGIGPGVTSNLAACGIRSAADFTGLAYVPGGGGRGQQIYLRLRNGGRVHPQGVGQKKATSLESWRQSVERQARASQPSTLPAEQANSIRSRFARELGDLQEQEEAARAAAASEVDAVRQKWLPVQAGLSDEKIAAQGDFARRRAIAQSEAKAAQQRVAEAIWGLAKAEQALAAYGNVTYAEFLGRLVKT